MYTFFGTCWPGNMGSTMLSLSVLFTIFSLAASRRHDSQLSRHLRAEAHLRAQAQAEVGACGHAEQCQKLSCTIFCGDKDNPENEARNACRAVDGCVVFESTAGFRCGCAPETGDFGSIVPGMMTSMTFGGGSRWAAPPRTSNLDRPRLPPRQARRRSNGGIRLW